MRLHLRRPRYADLMSTFAVFVTMTGVAYGATMVGTADIRNGAVTTPKIAAEAVTAGKIVPGAVTGGKLAANSVDGSKVVAHSLSLSDLAGVSRSGRISFTLNPRSCGNLSMGVTGATVGEAAVLTWIGTGKPPSGILVGPVKVTGPDRAAATACNLNAFRVVAQNVAVRIVTLK